MNIDQSCLTASKNLDNFAFVKYVLMHIQWITEIEFHHIFCVVHSLRIIFAVVIVGSELIWSVVRIEKTYYLNIEFVLISNLHTQNMHSIVDLIQNEFIFGCIQREFAFGTSKT